MEEWEERGDTTTKWPQSSSEQGLLQTVKIVQLILLLRKLISTRKQNGVFST